MTIENMTSDTGMMVLLQNESTCFYFVLLILPSGLNQIQSNCSFDRNQWVVLLTYRHCYWGCYYYWRIWLNTLLYFILIAVREGYEGVGYSSQYHPCVVLFRDSSRSLLCCTIFLISMLLYARPLSEMCMMSQHNLWCHSNVL